MAVITALVACGHDASLEFEVWGLEFGVFLLGAMRIKLQAPSAKHQGNSKLQASKGALVACGHDASLEFEVWSLEFSFLEP